MSEPSGDRRRSPLRFWGALVVLLLAPLGLLVVPGIPTSTQVVIALASWGFATVLAVCAVRSHRAVQADSDEHYRALFVDSGAVMLLIDPTSATVVEANAAAARYYGYPLEVLRGMSMLEINTMPAEDIAATMALARDRRKTFFEFQHRLAGGTVREVEVHSGPVVVDGRPLLYAIVNDVTERRRTAARLAAREEEFRLLAEDAEDVMYRVRYRPFRVSYASRAAASVLGVDADTLRSMPELLRQRVHPDDRVLWLDDHITEPTVASARWQRPDGTWIWLEDHAAPAIEDGEVVGRHGVIRDVSRRQRVEEALRETLAKEEAAIAELRRLDLMKDNFLRSVSHELRTPLAVVSGAIETLRGRAEHLDAQDSQDLLDAMQRHAGRLARLLDDLVDVHRLTQGDRSASRVAVRLTDVVRRAVADVDLEEHVLDVDVCDRVVEVEPALVERVVTNLVHNAVRHTPPGTTVAVRCNCASADLDLEVSDDGPGVPDELRRIIFEPFRQGPDAASAASPGTGIGLTLVERIAALHGGTVTVGTAPSGGAAFRVRFPSAAGACGADAPGREAGTEAGGARTVAVRHAD